MKTRTDIPADEQHKLVVGIMDTVMTALPNDGSPDAAMSALIYLLADMANYYNIPREEIKDALDSGYDVAIKNSGRYKPTN